jgi:hypothetical protein
LAKIAENSYHNIDPRRLSGDDFSLHWVFCLPTKSNPVWIGGKILNYDFEPTGKVCAYQHDWDKNLPRQTLCA